MPIESKVFVVAGCLFLASAGGLAAFGFHGPADILIPEKRDSWGWAVDMQFYHGMGLILTGILSSQLGASWPFRIAGILMIAGILIFSGLVYVNTLGALQALSGIVPNGGSMLMLSWIALAIGVLRARD